MTQVFHPSANSLARASIAIGALLAVAMVFAATFVDRSPYVTQVSVAVPQPVPFSHKHHVGELGIDCRYCHTSVETSAFAGIPAMETCMTCHSQIWRDSATLAPVRDNYAQDRAVAWQRVHDIPDYAYFEHDIHIKKGIGCETCHGRIDEMPLTWKVNTLHMDWCLDCHREPEKFIRPREDVFEMGYHAPADQLSKGKKLVEEYHVAGARITDCVTCHR